MNKSKALKRSLYAEGTPIAGPNVNSTTNTQEESTPASRQSLFLAWSNAGQTAEEQPNLMAGEAARLSVSVARGGCDRGWWLLRDPMTRRRGWARVSELARGPLALGLAAPRGYAAAKRTADVVLSMLLLVVLLPLFALTAILVRLDSPGPAFFRQRRIGKDGRAFLLWKLRSMYADAPPYAVSPTTNQDPRLTRVGRVIRRISIDELPQLINVLRGEMSLVGPRPEMPFIVNGYSEVERQRLAVKPGITGLWQVSPARALPIHQNLQYDFHYIRHQNVLLDGAILIRTVAAVISGMGAV
jgi:lipopolysaccharide/colanic/teichoic acid biosynthesis glycosyltransferase